MKKIGSLGLTCQKYRQLIAVIQTYQLLLLGGISLPLVFTVNKFYYLF